MNSWEGCTAASDLDDGKTHSVDVEQGECTAGDMLDHVW
jgi:hypothetical protein